MNEKQASLQQLLRRALLAQRELGMDEVVIDRSRLNRSRTSDLSMGAVPGQVVSVEDSLRAEKVRSEATTMYPSATEGAFTMTTSPAFESLASHREAICTCRLCPLGDTRTKFVYGVGNPKADILFIGEAPGRDEDLKGEPFVGRAGQLLDKILAAIQLSREQVYIANILKCRPPGNRDPQPDEMEQCFGYLREQVRLIQPKLICALGRIAGQALLKTTTPLGKLRGAWHQYEGIPLLLTYHPAALLRFPQYKRETWADMQMLKARYDMER